MELTKEALKRMIKEELEGVNIFFSTGDSAMTVHCFDEDSDMAIVIRDGGKKAIYTMSEWEVKELKKWLTEHLKNQK